MTQKYYLSTPIYYVNDVPHIGHTYTTLAADILARFHRQKGEDVFFLTGTDEHGQKIADEAAKLKLSPQEFCDQIAPRFQKAWKDLNFSPDFFIRTTDPRHEKVAADLLQKLYDNADLYQAKYEGLYCIGCEKFLTETDLVDNHCPLHPPEKTVYQKEENWFFRLSKYIPRLIKLIENDQTNYIFPEGKRKEILAKLRETKTKNRDQSFSRANLSWGIPVPWDKDQVIYVWVEALINYYSATVFLRGKKDFWPADLHLLAKDILWFHAVIWQAILLSAGLPLPKKIFVHSYALLDNQKISKSKGRLISPKELTDRYGVDATRYLLSAFFPVENDVSISLEKFDQRYHADLANNLGNLVSRLAALASQNNLSLNPPTQTSVFPEVAKALDNLDFPSALSFIWQKKLDPINQELNEKKPWTMSSDKARLLLQNLCLSLLHSLPSLKPFLPATVKKIEEIFLGEVKPVKTPLFARLEQAKPKKTKIQSLEKKTNQTVDQIQKTIIGRVLSLKKHPLADRLWLLQMEGMGEPQQVVCGADNLAKGQLVVWVLPGGQVNSLEGGKIKVKKVKIRGEDSHGMLCSAFELGIGEDYDQIHVLSPKLLNKIGQAFRPKT